MLSTLHIENIAVIEQAEIAFDSGFNVLTGETGAGKSIVIDAISAILGERASREMIRTGAQKAFVSAIFSGVPELPWFVENHVPYEPELGISREIFADGKKQLPRQRKARHSLDTQKAWRPADSDPWSE